MQGEAPTFSLGWAPSLLLNLVLLTAPLVLLSAGDGLLYLTLLERDLVSATWLPLLPLGAGGTLGTETIAADPTLIAWYTEAFDALVGNFLGGVMIFCVVAGLALSMNTATMDGSRALYGIAKDGMTIKQFAHLNRFRVPALAMTVDAVAANAAVDALAEQHRGPR